jgi:uncharacterized LabA/DUF88 family protein
MQRVVAYVDGFNLYFGMKSKGWRKLYWLNLVTLANALLKPDQLLEKVHYFTSRIRNTSSNKADTQRQKTYLEGLGLLPELDIHFGHFLEKPRQCQTCGAQWLSYEEKMTDVNIAVQMLTDAYEDLFDTAILISGDSDLTTPVTMLRQQFPSKRLIVAFPPGRKSNELSKASHGYLTIGEALLRQSQFPDEMSRPDGHVLARPVTWK